MRNKDGLDNLAKHSKLLSLNLVQRHMKYCSMLKYLLDTCQVKLPKYSVCFYIIFCALFLLVQQLDFQLNFLSNLLCTYTYLKQISS